MGTSTVVADKVYLGLAKKDEHDVYCYDTSKNEWSVLPPLDVRLFSLGQIQGRLVAVGGAKARPSRERTNEVRTFVENAGKWKKTYASMPTARSSTVVLSLESLLIVVGGFVYSDESSFAVELFKTSDLQWYICRSSANLPFSSVNASGVLMNANVYMMSGIRIGVDHNNVAYVSVDDLICHAVPANIHSQKHHIIDNSKHQSVSLWKMLPETPVNKAAISMLNGSLIAIGGEEGVDSKNGTSSIHIYSPLINSWINVGSLPGPRLTTTVSVLSPMEIIMIGGFDGTKDVNTVYKGILQLIT